MSSYRLFRIANKTQGIFNAQSRLASATRGPQSKSVLGRVLVFGALGTTATVGGAVVYANHDNKFKQLVDGYIPGFGSFVGISTDVWNQGTELARTGWNTIKPIFTPERGNTGMQRTTPTSSNKSTPSPDTPTLSSPDTPASSSPDAPPVVGEETTSKTPSAQSTDKEESGSTQTREGTVATPIIEKGGDSTSSEVETKLDERGINKNNEDATPVGSDVISEETLEPISSQEPTAQSEPTQEPQLLSQELEAAPDPVEVVFESSDLDSKKIQIENELRSAYHDFIIQSDAVIDSLQGLNQTLQTHFTEIKQSTTSPPENEYDIIKISEDIGAMKEKVDGAYKQTEVTKAAQADVSKRLSAAVAEALNLDILEELVEQICEKALEYQRSFEAANNDVDLTKALHKTWQEELQAAEMKRETTPMEEREDATGDNVAGDADASGQSQLPLKDLDTQQEALLLMLRKKIEGMEEEERKRISKALSRQEEELKRNFEVVLESEKKLFADQLQRKEHELDAYYEGKIKEQLYNQADAYSTHLSESLYAQAEDLREQLNEEFSNKMSTKEHEYQTSLVSAMAQLKGIHSMIDTVSEAGESTQRLQNIRTASDSLTTAIITANNDPSPFNKHLINKEVESLREAAQGDEFIQTVLSSIPKQALVEGISSESGLTKRFNQVRRIGKRVALVGEEGGGLGTYLLSFIQSLLTFDMIYDSILSRDRYDVESMNTYRILSCANGYLEKGDLETAVRVVNQLKGEARRVAQDWVREACLYLETRQAVLIVSEYLASSCYSTVQ